MTVADVIVEQVSSLLFHDQAVQSVFARHLRQEQIILHFSVLNLSTFENIDPNLLHLFPQQDQSPGIKFTITVKINPPGQASTGTLGMAMNAAKLSKVIIVFSPLKLPTRIFGREQQCNPNVLKGFHLCPIIPSLPHASENIENA